MLTLGPATPGRSVAVGGLQARPQARHGQQRNQHEQNHQRKKNGGERRDVEVAAQDFGGAGKFHFPLPFSLTMLTISAAARSMSRTILFTRLTR